METRKLYSYEYFMYIKCSAFVDYACFIDNWLDYFVNGSNLREETTNKVYFTLIIVHKILYITIVYHRFC